MTSLDNVKLHIVDSVSSAGDLLRWLSTRERVAVDSETEGLSPEHDRVRLVQLGDAEQGWAIPWDQWGGVFVEAVAGYRGEYVAHNLKFDAAMLRAAGVDLPPDRCHDTRLLAHVLEPTRSGALKNLAVRHVDRRAQALQHQLHESLASKREDSWRWDTVPIGYEPYWTYAGLDCVLTARLYDALRPQVETAGAARAYELELAVSWVCDRIERTGFLVDRSFTAARLTDFRERVEKLDASCEESYGCRPTQNAAVAEALIADGVQLDAVTATGAVKLDKEVLGPIDHPLAQLVLERRRLHKLASTYLENFLELTTDADPRLHGQLNTVGARTGRMSMAQPNLQNLPRKSDASAEAIVVRNCLIASPGRTLLMVDFDQIEMRVLAHLSGDPGLLEAFHDRGSDFFTTMSRRLFADPDIEKSDPRRQATKNACYAISYGAGPEKFALTAGLPFERGHAMFDRIKQLYPGIPMIQRGLESKAIERRTTTGEAYAISQLTGRRHPADDDKLYTLLNYLIQGTAAEVFKQKLVELDAAGLGDYMVLPVHDEIILDAPTRDLREVTRIVLDVMNDDEILRVPVTASASIGQRWGEKAAYKP